MNEKESVQVEKGIWVLIHPTDFIPRFIKKVKNNFTLSPESFCGAQQRLVADFTGM